MLLPPEGDPGNRMLRGSALIDRAPSLHLAPLLFTNTSSTTRVAALAAAPILLSAALLLTSADVLSREMTWDLLFNLEGAWHMQVGHVPHVDFHTPLGVLSFLPTLLAFRIAGAMPRAVLIGQFLVMVPTFLGAAFVAARRLPFVPAAIFVAYVALLVLLPVNIGDHPNAYSFAMSYNRWGWSALATLCLLLFLEPADDATLADAVVAGLLLLFLFFLKVTFAAAGLASLIAAVTLSGHLRPHLRLWAWTIGVVLLIVAAPYNRAYFKDIWWAAATGYLRLEPGELLVSFFANKAEYALDAAAVLALAALWKAGLTRASTVAGAAIVLGLGVAVLSQNSQAGDVPPAIVVFFLIYRALVGKDGHVLIPGPPRIFLLMTVVAWPLLAIASELATVSGYYRAAGRAPELQRITSTNLRGLAVPVDDHELDDSLKALSIPLLSPTRDHPLRDPITQSTYLNSLLNGAAILADSRPAPRVLVLDQVNALPFVLGSRPPKGGNLWQWPETPPRSAEEVFGDVDVVMVPKYSTLARSTVFMLETYVDYLSAVFPEREDTASWTILRRPHK